MTVCVNCNMYMKVKEIGVLLVQTVGKEQRPQSIVQADVEWCPKCGAQIIAKVADESIEHFQAGFHEAIIQAHEGDMVYYVHEKNDLVGQALREMVVPGS